MPNLPPGPVKVATKVKPISCHAMGMSSRRWVASREEPELSVPLFGSSTGCRTSQMLDPVQDKIRSLRPQCVAKRPASLPQKR